MYLEMLNSAIQSIDSWLWGWPLVGYVIIIGSILTFALGFVQFRYFFKAWQFVFAPGKGAKETENYITPFQAFLNTLNAGIGNGSVAGMATAIVGGGPGAAFWIFILGFLYMAIRYAEVYTSIEFNEEMPNGTVRGGPMVYLKKVPFGAALAYGYAIFGLGLSFITGNAMQCNSIALGVERLTGFSSWVSAIALILVMLYIMFGGAKRIIQVSEKIVPVKVGLFFVATLIALIYHGGSLLHALKLIWQYALTPQALAGGALGFSVQQAIRFGMSRSMNSTEAGLGTAGILYGSTRGQDPVKTGISSMITTFISSHLVGFALMVLFVASGVWNSGLQSTQLTMSAYESVFGTFGSVVVAFLTITFGLGLLVTYAYIGREFWMYVFKGKFQNVYTIIYCAMAFIGAVAKVDLIWNATGIVNAGLVAINMFALIYLLPKIRAGLVAWQHKQH